MQAFRQRLGVMLRKPPLVLQALRGPNEMREVADAGCGILKIQEESGAVAHYHHLSFIRYQPLRPVLLRLEVLPSVVGIDVAELDARDKVFLRAARAPAGHWSYALDCSAYSWVDLQKPQVLCVLAIQNAIAHQDGSFIIQARSFRTGQRLIWRGHAQKIPEQFSWERPGRRCARDEEHDGDESGDEKSSTSDGEEIEHDKGRSSGPSELAAPSRGVAPERAATARRAPQRSGSNQDWARPLVPGHMATGVAVPAAVAKNFFGRVARSRTGETWWEARFSGNAGENLAMKVKLPSRSKFQ